MEQQEVLNHPQSAKTQASVAGRASRGVTIAASVENAAGLSVLVSELDEEEVREHNVFVTELPVSFPADHFDAMMSQFGTVASSRLFNNTRRVVQTGKAYGFCLYRRSGDAKKAVSGLHGMIIEGRPVEARLASNGVVKAPPVRGTRSQRPQRVGASETLTGGATSTATAAPPANAMPFVAPPVAVSSQGVGMPLSAMPTPFSGPLVAAAGPVSPFAHPTPYAGYYTQYGVSALPQMAPTYRGGPL